MFFESPHISGGAFSPQSRPGSISRQNSGVKSTSPSGSAFATPHRHSFNAGSSRPASALSIGTPASSAQCQRRFSDRFIPNRDSMNTEASQFFLNSPAEDGENCNEHTELSPARKNTMRLIKENLFSNSPRSILSFQDRSAGDNRRATQPFSAERKALSEVVDAAETHGRTGSTQLARQVTPNPDRILDAPDLRCDFYLNVLDWSSSNLIAIALGDTVYLWNADTGSIQELFRCENEQDYVASLSWAADGVHLSIGTSMNQLQIWDVQAGRQVRSMRNHYGRICSTAWNNHVLSAGSKTGTILNHDVRIRDNVVNTLGSGHHQEVCGLKWSPDGRYLASGGNDNVVNVWNHGGRNIHRWKRHTAAVKAIAWCPWHSSTLATGGGTDDRTIKLWNVNVDSRNSYVGTTDTKSQISSLQWNTEHRELLSAHGFSDNFLSLWKYKAGTLSRFVDLKGHTERILGTTISPDGATVVSAGADETLRFWKCFAGASKRRIRRRGQPESRLATTLR